MTYARNRLLECSVNNNNDNKSSNFFRHRRWLASSLPVVEAEEAILSGLRLLPTPLGWGWVILETFCGCVVQIIIMNLAIFFGVDVVEVTLLSPKVGFGGCARNLCGSKLQILLMDEWFSNANRTNRHNGIVKKDFGVETPPPPK